MYVITNSCEEFLSEINRYKNIFCDSIKEAMIFESEDEAKAMGEVLSYTENSFKICEVKLQGV